MFVYANYPRPRLHQPSGNHRRGSATRQSHPQLRTTWRVHWRSLQCHARSLSFQMWPRLRRVREWRSSRLFWSRWERTTIFSLSSGKPSRKRERKHKFGQCQNASKLASRFWRENANGSRLPVKPLSRHRRAWQRPLRRRRSRKHCWRRFSQLLFEETNNLSPFTVPRPPVDISAELSRMQGVINDLQRELGLRPVQPVDSRTTSQWRWSPPHNQHPCWCQSWSKRPPRSARGLPQGVGQVRDCRT